MRYDVIGDSFDDNLITYSFLQFGKMIFIRDCMADYRQTDQGIWVGEKDCVNYIRGLISYDIENMINPNMKKISMNRHLYDFKPFAKNHDIFDDVDQEFLKLAKMNNCQTAIRVLEKNIYLLIIGIGIVEL